MMSLNILTNETGLGRLNWVKLKENNGHTRRVECVRKPLLKITENMFGKSLSMRNIQDTSTPKKSANVHVNFSGII